MTTETVTPTGRLRWLRPPETTTAPDRLQQQFMSLTTGRAYWQDVPVELAAPAQFKEPDNG